MLYLSTFRKGGAKPTLTLKKLKSTPHIHLWERWSQKQPYWLSYWLSYWLPYTLPYWLPYTLPYTLPYWLSYWLPYYLPYRLLWLHLF